MESSHERSGESPVSEPSTLARIDVGVDSYEPDKPIELSPDDLQRARKNAERIAEQERQPRKER